MDVRTAVVEWLTHPWTEAERHASARPPYPVPEPVAERRERVVEAASARLPADDDDFWVVGSPAGPPSRLEGAIRRIDGRRAVPVLLASGAISVADAEEIAAQVESVAPVIWRQLVLVHLRSGDVDAATGAATRMGDHAYVGHRAIGAHLARLGRDEEFFERWPHYAAARGRNDMVRLKEGLVRGVADARGVDAALALTRHQRLGPDFRVEAFSGLADAGHVEELHAMLTGPMRGLLPVTDELWLLVRAVVADSPEAPQQDHPRLAELLDRVIALDVDDRGTMRIRNSLLLGLWPAFGDQASLDRAYRAARGPQAKRDISRRLPRDVPTAVARDGGDRRR